MVFLANLFRAANSANLSFSTALVYFLIFSTYALATGNPVTSRMVFTTMPLVTFVRMLTFYYIVEAVLGVREIKVAVRRIQVRTYNCSCEEIYKGFLPILPRCMYIHTYLACVDTSEPSFLFCVHYMHLCTQDFLLRDQSDRRCMKNYSHEPVLTPEQSTNLQPCNGVGSSQPQKVVPSKRTSARVKVNNLSAAWEFTEGGTSEGNL